MGRAVLEMVERLEKPPPGSRPIAFDTQYARGEGPVMRRRAAPLVPGRRDRLAVTAV